jgi:hypothetical protein
VRPGTVAPSRAHAYVSCAAAGVQAGVSAVRVDPTAAVPATVGTGAVANGWSSGEGAGRAGGTSTASTTTADGSLVRTASW